MMSDPPWLPALVKCDEGWEAYVNDTHQVFRSAFIESQPTFEGAVVICDIDPIENGREAGYQHCTSGGKAAGIPEIPRMERIRWPRAIIENFGDPLISDWWAKRGTKRRRCLWFREEFLVVLEKRNRLNGTHYWRLITAYDTPQEHRKKKLRAEFAAHEAEKANAASGQGNGVRTPSVDDR